MQIERGRRGGAQLLSEGFVDGWSCQGAEANEGFAFSAADVSHEVSSPSPSPPRMSPGVGSIEHRVSKMDTLAGIAIKYGVEVSDIKKMNGLVTDLQMFAHKKLHIPLPGRHPPSPILTNGSYQNGEQSPPRRRHSDVLTSFQSLTLKPQQQKVSPAMSILQGYYGLTPPRRGSTTEGTEMAVYKSGKTVKFLENSMSSTSTIPETPPTHNQYSRSLVNGFLPKDGLVDSVFAEDEGSSEVDKSNNENSVRRRQKIDVDSHCHTPELIEENGGAFSGRIGKGPFPRPKSGSRTDLDSARPNTNLNGDSFMGNGFFTVRKSSSTSNLQDSDSSSTKPTNKWTDALTRPLFDGLPKPVALRRNKAAID